jgi:hypothetical protein
MLLWRVFRAQVCVSRFMMQPPARVTALCGYWLDRPLCDTSENRVAPVAVVCGARLAPASARLCLNEQAWKDCKCQASEYTIAFELCQMLVTVPVCAVLACFCGSSAALELSQCVWYVRTTPCSCLQQGAHTIAIS